MEQLNEGYYDGIIVEASLKEPRFTKDMPEGSFEVDCGVKVGDVTVSVYIEVSSRTLPWDANKTFFERASSDLKQLGYRHFDQFGYADYAAIETLANTPCRIQAKLGKPNKDGNRFMQYTFAFGAKAIQNKSEIASRAAKMIAQINALRPANAQIKTATSVATAAQPAAAPTAPSTAANPFG